MKRAALVVCASLGPSILGCAGFSHQSPPGPQPIADAWRPRAVLRERVPNRPRADVILSDRDGLSPDEAAIMAVDQNPRLRAIRGERGIARAELISAGVLPNPRLDGSIDPTWYGPEATVLGYGVGLSWNVTPLLSRGARVSAAQEGAISVELDIAWQEWQVAQAARLHTVRAIYLERRVTLAGELEETWQRRIKGLRQARAAGAVTEIEVANAERSYAEARMRRLEVEQRLAAERAELNRAIGVDPTRQLVLDSSFAPPAEAPAGQGVLDDLPRRRLDLIALQHAHRSHDEALRAAVAARFPPLEIGFETRREVDQNASVGMTLGVEIPFFDRNQGAALRQRAQRTKIEAEYDARLFEARADVLRTVKELRLVGKQLRAAREAAEASGRLAEQARAAAVSGALNPLLAADILQRSYGARLRVLQVEQLLAELRIALAVASGVDVR